MGTVKCTGWKDWPETKEYKTAFHTLYNSTTLCITQYWAAHLWHAVTFTSHSPSSESVTELRNSPAFVCLNLPAGLRFLGCSSQRPPGQCGSVPGTCTCCDPHLGWAPQHAGKLRQKSVKEVITDRHHHNDWFRIASIMTGERES